MSADFHERLIELGGIRINERFVLSPVREWTRYLLAEDGGCALGITGFGPDPVSDASAVEQAQRFLEKHPNPRLDYSGPPTPQSL